MADLTSRPISWTDYLPAEWQSTINRSPLINALSAYINRRPADIEGASKRIFSQPGDREMDDRAWLLQQAQPQRRLNPLAAEMLDKGGLLANFLGPGVKLPPVAPKPAGIRAYHGSPHDFDRFDLSKIGTGEGAQAYGRGLYFAESEGVARSYRDNVKDMGRVDAINQRLTELAREMTKLEKPGQYRQYREPRGYELAAEYDRLMNEKLSPPPGKMYEVNIKADPEQFLDWDKPLSQQPEARAIFDRLRVDTTPETPHDNPAVNNIRAALARANMRRDDWQDALKRPETVQALRDAGIPGIKYLDQGSRAAGQGSRNYVVFDDKLIEILRKYGLLPPVAAGTAAALNQQEPPQ